MNDPTEQASEASASEANPPSDIAIVIVVHRERWGEASASSACRGYLLQVGEETDVANFSGGIMRDLVRAKKDWARSLLEEGLSVREGESPATINPSQDRTMHCGEVRFT